MAGNGELDADDEDDDGITFSLRVVDFRRTEGLNFPFR